MRPTGVDIADPRWGWLATVMPAGTTELWTVHNTHNQPHNFHVHGVAFQIVPAGASMPDPQLGWKDTVLLAAGEAVQLAINFPPYRDPLTPYMYHCHLMCRPGIHRRPAHRDHRRAHSQVGV